MCLWLFKISNGMNFIPLQSMVCVSYHCRNEMCTQLGYHSNKDPQIYTIDYPASKSWNHQSLAPSVAMKTQYDVIPFLKSYETQWYEMHTSSNFEMLKTDFLKQIFFLKSINSLFKVDFKATGKRSTLSSSENRMVSTIYTYFSNQTIWTFTKVEK